MNKGSVSSSEADKRKRKRLTKPTKRYGIDTDISETDSESMSTPVKKPLKLKRSNALLAQTDLGSPFAPTGYFIPQHSTPSHDSTNEIISENELLTMTPLKSPEPLAALSPTKSLPTSLTSSSATQTESCHCCHQEHWAKEILRSNLRIEDLIRNGGNTSVQDISYDKENETFPSTYEDAKAFFMQFREDKEKRVSVLRQTVKCVVNSKRKSIQAILLHLAPPSVWTKFSKNGQRGKTSAMEYGIHDLIIDCMTMSKVSKT